MKRANLMVFGLLFGVIFMLSPNTCAQTAPTPVFPDYTNWKRIISNRFPVNLDGKDIELLQEVYSHTDLVNLKRNSVNLLYNEAGSLWFARHVEDIGERHPDGSITTKEKSRYYLFENINGKWVFVRDFSTVKNQDEFYDFLKERYGVEFK